MLAARNNTLEMERKTNYWNQNYRTYICKYDPVKRVFSVLVIFLFWHFLQTHWYNPPPGSDLIRRHGSYVSDVESSSQQSISPHFSSLYLLERRYESSHKQAHDATPRMWGANCKDHTCSACLVFIWECMLLSKVLIIASAWTMCCYIYAS